MKRKYSMTMNPATDRFDLHIAVLPEDIDIFNHVNNVVYLRWVQNAATAHWDAAATDEQRQAVGWVVVRHEIDFLRSAVLGDEIVARTWVGTAVKNTFERHTEILRRSDMKLLARARSYWCPIDWRTRKPVRVGPDIHARFSVPAGTAPSAA